MKKTEFTYPSDDHKTQIHAIRWEPDGPAAGILQISHGMVEYIGRYEEFARCLCERGYVVTGNDHLGHGLSVTGDDMHGYFAEENGNRSCSGISISSGRSRRKCIPACLISFWDTAWDPFWQDSTSA